MPSSPSPSEIRSVLMEQIETKTLLSDLTKKVEWYMDKDEDRYVDYNHCRLETARLLAECATTLKELKCTVDHIEKDDVPDLKNKTAALDKDVASNAKIINIHDWFLKAIITVTVVATLGGAFMGLKDCSSISAGTSSHQNQTSVRR